MKKYKILDINLDPLTVAEAEENISTLLNCQKEFTVTTVNTEFIIKAQTNPEFKKYLNNFSTLNLADGAGVIWAGKFLSFKELDLPVLREIIIFLQWLGTILLIPTFPRLLKGPIPEKITGSDFVWNLARLAQKENLRIFLLGGKDTVAERAALKLQTDIYGLKLAGVSSFDPAQTEQALEAINRTRPDLLFVAYGCPTQELWLQENLKKTTAKLGIGLGGTFDFLAETRKRAPAWMQHSGLEWLFRLFQEPRRLGRQLTIPHFMYLILLDKLKK